MTVIPKSLEHQLKNLKLEIQKLEDKVEQLQENNQNQEIVISQLKTVNETTQSQLTELVKDLQVQKSRNDELEERFNALKPNDQGISINIISGHIDKNQKEWRDMNFSGCYHIAEMVNDRPAYKRESKTENGNDIYLWYDEARFWNLSYASDFQDRNRYKCLLRINSSEPDVPKLSGTWFEWMNGKFKEVAEVTISSNNAAWSLRDQNDVYQKL